MSNTTLPVNTSSADNLLRWSKAILNIAVWISSLLFGLYILSFYVAAIGQGDLSVWNNAALPDLYEVGEPAATAGIGIHFAMGALILILGSIQFVDRLRVDYPKAHRVLGKIYLVASFLTAVGGLTFILVSGTIGGGVMNIGFALYGLLMLFCTIETYRHIRAGRFEMHNEWAMRLYALAIGSWLYRMSYGFWILFTNGLWVGESFMGPFDYFMDFAFYIPSLIVVELMIRSRRENSTPRMKWLTVGGLGTAIALVAIGTYA
ncbi:MAG: DUF2306 domain-containing protein, partial [Candidatus Promineifilaceae bacterium]